MQSKPESLNIKELLRRAKVGYTQLTNRLKSGGIEISRTSTRDLINQGRLSRKVDIARVEDFIAKNYPRELDSLGIDASQLWEPYNGELSKVTRAGRNIVKPGESELDKLMIKLIGAPNMLRPEILAHFGLNKNQNPFLPETREIFKSTWHKYAKEMMDAAAETGSLMVITGQVGSGKSTAFADFQAETGRGLHIIRPAADPRRMRDIDILHACVFDLSEENPKRGIELLTRQVKRLLASRIQNNIRVLMVIDNAEAIPLETIKSIKRIWEMNDGLQRLMGIILIGQNELEGRLFGESSAMSVREFTNRATHVKLSPLDEQTREYVEFRIKTAGGKVGKIISAEALELLPLALSAKDYNDKLTSTSYPLQVNRLMMMLMEHAYEYGDTLITPETLKSAGFIKAIPESAKPIKQVK